MLGFGLPAIGVALVMVAGACDVYVPVFGRRLAVGFALVGVAVFAFDRGYELRGEQDNVAALRFDLAAAQAQTQRLRTASEVQAKIAEAANACERDALNQAADAQEMVRRCAAKVQAQKAPGCVLSASDVGGLSGINASSRPRVRAAAPRRTCSFR